MSHYRPLSPKSPLKPKEMSHKVNKLHFNTPPVGLIGESKCSEKVTTISQRSDGEYDSVQHDFPIYGSAKAEIDQELKEVKEKLAKEEEKNFIYQNFFRKIQKMLYSQNSKHLEEGDIKNYEKLELHLTDMAKRIEKSTNYAKLEAVPVIYKKGNTVTTSRVMNKTGTK